MSPARRSSALPEALARHLMSESEPAASVTVLAQFDARRSRASARRCSNRKSPHELRELLRIPGGFRRPADGPNVTPIRSDLSIAEALARLRAVKSRGLRELFVVDEEMRLIGRVEIQDLAMAEHAQASARDHPPAHRRGDRISTRAKTS